MKLLISLAFLAVVSAVAIKNSPTSRTTQPYHGQKMKKPVFVKSVPSRLDYQKVEAKKTAEVPDVTTVESDAPDVPVGNVIYSVRVVDPPSKDFKEDMDSVSFADFALDDLVETNAARELTISGIPDPHNTVPEQFMRMMHANTAEKKAEAPEDIFNETVDNVRMVDSDVWVDTRTTDDDSDVSDESDRESKLPEPVRIQDTNALISNFEAEQMVEPTVEPIRESKMPFEFKRT